MVQKHTFSLIVETENLGMAGLEDLERSLDSLKAQVYPVEKLHEVLLIAGGHVSKPVLTKLVANYPWIKVSVAKTSLDYARSKMRGAEVATGTVLIFADSDMQYQPSWLGNMIQTIESEPAGTIVSGDTRLKTTSAYRMALNCTWMIQVLSDKPTRPVVTAFFPLNNFAIERELMLRIPLPYTLHLYRNKIPLWEALLIQAGCRIVRAPGSRGHHAPPGTFGDWFYRMLIYGADFVAQADFSVGKNGKVIEKRNLMGRVLRLLFLSPWKIEQLFLNAYKLLREDVRRMRYVPGALLLGLANSIVIILGGVIACMNRDFVFEAITERETGHVV